MFSIACFLLCLISLFSCYFWTRHRYEQSNPCFTLSHFRNNNITETSKKLRRVFFFFYFEQLGLPAAKNPFRVCARMLLQYQNITVGYYCVVVEEQMKVLLSASVSQQFYTEIVISNFKRKVSNALTNILLR